MPCFRPMMGALCLAALSTSLLGCSGGGKGPSDGGSPVLTVKNYLSWCSVSVNGGAGSTAATLMQDVDAGVVGLKATPASSSFMLGAWHHTDGDTGAGDPGTVTGTGATATSTTTVTLAGASKCVWICCPFTSGTGCPTTDQCP
jgi:hypothetical protein